MFGASGKKTPNIKMLFLNIIVLREAWLLVTRESQQPCDFRPARKKTFNFPKWLLRARPARPCDRGDKNNRSNYA